MCGLQAHVCSVPPAGMFPLSLLLSALSSSLCELRASRGQDTRGLNLSSNPWLPARSLGPRGCSGNSHSNGQNSAPSQTTPRGARSRVEMSCHQERSEKTLLTCDRRSGCPRGAGEDGSAGSGSRLERSHSLVSGS